MKKMSKIIIFIFSLFIFNFSNAQDLKLLTEKALENNPEIQKFELQYKITSEKVNEVHAIPNTEVAVGYFISEPETRTGAQRAKVSIKQMIPWFGSITAREHYMNSLADAKFEDIAIVKRKLVLSVSQSYYNLYAIKATQKVVLANIELLKNYETMALKFVETGKSSVVDVLRLQMRQNELQQSKEILEQQYIAEQTVLNNLLNRDKTVAIVLNTELMIPTGKELRTSENLKLHPELLKYDKLYASVANSELLNKKESAPMLGFGLDYIAVSEIPNTVFNDNGKDIVMPMISVSIPIFNKKYKSKTKQNRLKQEEIIAQKQARFNLLETALDKAIANRAVAKIQYATQAKNLLQAQKAEEIVLKNYETGMRNFNDVLDIQELQLKFQKNQIASVKKYFIQTASINYLSK
ncbi:MAG: TolC family protein [Polaribacter sp.]|nr:TolC family protein [Polaribacter sp.]